MNNVYDWQYNVIPGNANQGSILLTRNDITRPPFTQDDFIWKAMEDVIGVSNCRLDYDEKHNIYTLLKAKGHLDNHNEWYEEWAIVGSWNGITEETQEALKSLVYIEYKYDTSEVNRLIISGVKKDGTEDVLVNITFSTKEEFDIAVETINTRITNEVNTLNTRIDDETTRATTREDQLDLKIDNEITRATNKENLLDEKIDNEIDRATTRENEIEDKVNNLINDTVITNDKTWSSNKISQEMTSALHYKGQIATVSDLPETATTGDLYNVEDTGDNYCYNGTSWDKLSGDYINGHGIIINGKTISAKGNNSQGIDINANGIGVKIDGTSVKFNSNGQIYVDPQQVTDINSGDATDIGDNNEINVKVDNETIGINEDNELKNLYKVNSGIATEVDNNENVNVKYNSTNLKVNESNQLDTVLQIWNGTQAEYDAITTKDPNTLYLINEE